MYWSENYNKSKGQTFCITFFKELGRATRRVPGANVLENISGEAGGEGAKGKHLG